MKPALLAAFAILAPECVTAGPMDRACQQANRVANPLLCECIQRVANMTLTSSDQRLAAKFFEDPARADQVRMSGSDAHQAFWERYIAFGATAERICTP